MADYSQDVTQYCLFGDCKQYIVVDWADKRRFVCDFHRRATVASEIDRMMGGASGSDAQFNVIQALTERILVLEGRLPK